MGNNVNNVSDQERSLTNLAAVGGVLFLAFFVHNSFASIAREAEKYRQNGAAVDAATHDIASTMNPSTGTDVSMRVVRIDLPYNTETLEEGGSANLLVVTGQPITETAVGVTADGAGTFEQARTCVPARGYVVGLESSGTMTVNDRVIERVEMESGHSFPTVRIAGRPILEADVYTSVCSPFTPTAG